VLAQERVLPALQAAAQAVVSAQASALQQLVLQREQELAAARPDAGAVRRRAQLQRELPQPAPAQAAQQALVRQASSQPSSAWSS